MTHTYTMTGGQVVVSSNLATPTKRTTTQTTFFIFVVWVILRITPDLTQPSLRSIVNFEFLRFGFLTNVL